MREPLPYKELHCKEVWRRAILFDPTPVYALITVDPYKRYQSIPISSMFPKQIDRCACGCGAILTGKRTMWATDDCHKFAALVQSFICGGMGDIKRALKQYYEWNCMDCGTDDKGRVWERSGYVVDDIQIDHIVGVKHGGGGCWLSNYKFRCGECHTKKTNKDFNRKQVSPTP